MASSGTRDGGASTAAARIVLVPRESAGSTVTVAPAGSLQHLAATRRQPAQLVGEDVL
jgi:hypothetical protein